MTPPLTRKAWARGGAAAALAAPLWHALAGQALAAGDGHGNPWLDLAWKAVNVTVLFAIIFWVARKPVAQGMTALAKQVLAAYSGARSQAREAEEALAAQKQKIAALEQELARMVAEAKADVEREKQRAQADARAQAEKLRAQTQQQIAQELAKARMEMRQQVAAETLRLAEELIKGKMNPAQQQRLVEDYLKQLGERR